VPDGSESDTNANLDTGALTAHGSGRIIVDPLSDPGPPDPTASPLRRFAPGDVLDDRYTIVEEVGAGGMGVVYKAVDKRLGKPVAIKLIRPRAMNETGIARFRRELALAQRVSHPNVCRLHDLGEVDGLLYISMQHVEGQRLDHLIVSMGHLSPKQTVALGRQLCAGLAAIHEQGIIHRDLKPSNLMVDRAGHVYIMDFGLAVRPEGEDRVTSTGAVLGTLAYLSPEQARGHGVGPQSDIFAVGLILFEMLTGRCPPADNVALPLALRDPTDRCPAPSTLEPEVPPSLDDVVLRCLARSTVERYATAAAAGEGLELAQGDLSSASAARRLAPHAPTLAGLTPPGPAATDQDLAIRVKPRVAMAIVAAVVILLGGFGVWRYVNRAKPPQAQPGKPVALAVMPFKYTGPEDQAYLKDLLPLILSERLRKSADLDTAPFSSTRTLGATEDVKSVNQQLGVAAVIYGELTGKNGELKLLLSMRRPDIKSAIWTKEVNGDANTLIPRTELMATDLSALMGARWNEKDSPFRKRNPKTMASYAEGRTLLEGWDVERSAERAADAFRRALSDDESFAEAHSALALALWRQYEERRDPTIVEKALAAAQRAVSLEPMLPEGQLALGTIQLVIGRSVEATTAFERAQALAPGDDAVCRLIGSAYSQRSRPADAERVLQQAIDLRPGFWENYNAKGAFLMSRGRFEEARGLFQKVIALRPQGDTGYVNLAAVHIFMGDLDAAEPLLEAAAKIQPSRTTFGNLGMVHYSKGHFDKAATDYERAIGGDAEGAHYGNLGDALRQLHRSDEARAAYMKALDLAETRLRVNPKDATYRAAVSMWLAGAGRCDEAEREMNTAVGQEPKNPVLLCYAAQAAAVCGNEQLTIDYATRAMRGGASGQIKMNPDVRHRLGESAAGRRLLASKS
jgi:eukaryotic-like serine/threonine-protein kinase